MSNPTIAVFGATGAQGGSVVRHLKNKGGYNVRALTRDPSKYDGPGDEAVAANLDDEQSLADALEDADGVFLVTNFWQAGTDEAAQAKAAIRAAQNAGVRHFVWSSLPDVEAISEGKWVVPHFTNKARIDPIVQAAGFPIYTVVQPSFYFENLTGSMAPTPLEGGLKGWAVPINPEARVIHMGAIEEFGGLVEAAFSNPDKSNGKTLSMAAGVYSFADIVEAFNALEENHAAIQVSHEAYANFFPGADEIGQMLGYFEDHTYMGPDSDDRIDAANDIISTSFTTFSEWLKKNHSK